MKRGWLWLTVGFIAVSIVNLAVVVVIATRPATPDPLGEYPVQRVINVTATDVIVEAIKCTDIPVRVSGVSSWRRVDQPGVGVSGFRGVGERTGGCQTFMYVNTFPPEVLAQPGVWQLVGEECPIDDHGKVVGLCRTWETENFVVG